MTPPGSNLAIVLRELPAWFAGGDAGRLASLFAEDAVWQGIRPEQVCEGRDEIVGRLDRGARGLRLTGFQAREDGDRVTVHVESPDLPETEDLAAGAPRSLSFTFRAGLVVRMETLAPAS